MARTPKPWFWHSAPNGWAGWYVTLDGKRECLKKTEKRPTLDRRKQPIVPQEIQNAFHDLMSRRNAEFDGDNSPAKAICEAYLQHLEANGKLHPYHTITLQSWCEHTIAGKKNANVKVALLRRQHLDDWATANAKRWAVSTRTQRKTIVKGCFQWALAQERITRNPFANVEIGQVERRNNFTKREDHIKLMWAADHNMRLFLFALWHAGCRPGEVTKITPEMVDLKNSCWILPKHKTRGKTGAPKIIQLDPKLKRICALLLKKRKPGEPLFKNRLGTAYQENDIGQRIRRLRDKLGLDPKLMPVSYRHAMTTRLLENELFTDTDVAAIMGWTNTKIIHQHYSHVGENRRRLQSKLEEFARKKVKT